MDRPETEVTQSSQNAASGADGRFVQQAPTVRAAALILREGKLLLVRQDRMGESYWLLPGGGVRFGESLHDAVVRELREELALDVVPGRPVALVEAISDDMTRYPKHVVHVIVAAELATADQMPRLGGDKAVLEAGFVAADELRALRVTPPIGEFLADWVDAPREEMTYLGVRW